EVKRDKEGHQKYSNPMQKLRTANKLLKAQIRLLAAKAHNCLKAANRARLATPEQSIEHNRLLRDFKAVTACLQEQEIARELTARRSYIDLDRAKKSQKNWWKRARAAKGA
ncbi:hypothetical protein FRC11_013142, partial [Ceratobasidium sp. 423]